MLYGPDRPDGCGGKKGDAGGHLRTEQDATINNKECVTTDEVQTMFKRCGNTAPDPDSICYKDIYDLADDLRKVTNEFNASLCDGEIREEWLHRILV